MAEAPAHGRILVVDDEQNITELVAMAMRYVGFDVVTASSGREALATVPDYRPDLVVLDVMMPVHDGLGVLRAMRDEPTTAAIPVVLLTARAADHEIAEGWDAGADYYLTKPFRVEQLLEFIDALAASSR
jgi:DNA-binding response OmpR family regulator